MNQARQERTGCENNGSCPDSYPKLRHHSRDACDSSLILDDKIVHRLLKQGQVGLILKAGAYCLPIKDSVSLGTSGPYCGPFAGIEDPELDTGFVSCQRHRAAKRVYFLYEVPLSDPANGRIARHLPQCFHAVREEQCRSTHPGGRKRRFGPGMPATNDDDIELIWVKHDDQKSV